MFAFQAFMTAAATSGVRGYQLKITNGPSISIQMMIASYFTMVTVHHLSMLTDVVHQRYLKDLANNTNTFRWCEYAVTASTIVFVLGFLAGVEDITMLMILFLNMVLVIVTGAWAEWDGLKSWFPHVCSWLLFAHMWGQLFLQVWKLEAGIAVIGSAPDKFNVVHATVAQGSVEETVLRLKILHPLMPRMFILFCLFGVVQTLQMLQIGPWKHYFAAEVSYIALSLITKTTMGFFVLHANYD
jgi:hypothetical protein